MISTKINRLPEALREAVGRQVILKVDPGSEHVTCTCKSIELTVAVDHWIHVV